MCQSHRGAWRTAMVSRHRKTGLLILLLTIYGLPGFTWGATLVNPRQISVGSMSACSLDDGGVHCWGSNIEGQLNVPALTNPRQVVVGGVAACAVDDTGVHCWGDNTYGETNVPALSNPWQVGIGAASACALDDTGVHCWGDNTYGETNVPALSNPWRILMQSYTACALDDTGEHCWGNNASGQANVPTTLSNPQQIAVGLYSACALDDTGVHCWGDNSHGQTNVPALSNPRQVVVGLYTACALDDTGVHCWGDNTYGETNIPTLVHPVQVTARQNSVCALDDNGIKCWGANPYRQITLPTQSMTKYLSADVDNYINSPSSPLNVLRSYLTSADGPAVTIAPIIHSTNVASGQLAPTYTIQRDPTGIITSLTITSNDSVAPLPNVFWYAIGQIVFEALQGSIDQPLRCVFSTIDPSISDPPSSDPSISFMSLNSLNDIFVGPQTDACAFREAFLQTFVLLATNGNTVNLNTIQTQINQGYFPVGVSRADQMFPEFSQRRSLVSPGSEEAGATGFLELLAHTASAPSAPSAPSAAASSASSGSFFSWLFTSSNDDTKLYTTSLNKAGNSARQGNNISSVMKPVNGVGPPPLEGVVEAVRQDCEIVPGACDSTYLKGDGSFTESNSLCRQIQMGASGTFTVQEADCAESLPVLCSATNSDGTPVAWVTSASTPLLKATQACETDGTHSGTTDKRAVDDPSQPYVQLALQPQTFNSVLGIGPDSEAQCVVLQQTGTTPTSASYSLGAAIDCANQARVLCQNEQNPNNVLMTTKSYPLAQADFACEAEFGNQLFGSGPVFYQGAPLVNYTTPGTNLPTTLATGLVMSSNGRTSQKRSASEISNDENEVVAIDTKIRKVEAASSGNAFLQVHAITVGAGSCYVVQCIAPNGQAVQSALIDCGSTNYRQRNANGVPTPFALSGQGIMDYLLQEHVWDDTHPTIVVSHGDWDHYKYIEDLMVGKTAASIYLGGSFAVYNQDFQDWIGHQREAGVTIYANNFGIQNFNTWTNAPAPNHPTPDHITTFTQCGGASLDVLAVNQGNVAVDPVSRNRNSAVLQLKFENTAAPQFFTAIFPGDALLDTENAASANLVPPYTNTLLMASHHGSTWGGSNSENWVNTVRPTAVVYSAGNRYSHPFCEVVNEFENIVGPLDPQGQHPIQCGQLIQPPPPRGNPRFYPGPAGTDTKTHYGTRLSGSVVAIVTIPSNPNTMPRYSLVRREGP